MWFQSRVLPKPRWNRSHSSLYQLTAMETAKSVRVWACQKLKGCDNPWAHTLMQPPMLMHVHKYVSVTFLYVKRGVRKVGKGQSEQLQHTSSHSILQTRQPFKHLSVTVTPSNPYNQSLHPPFSRDTDPLPGERRTEWTSRQSARRWERGCNFSHSALTKVQHYPPS